jgi:hypothetical protein
MRPAQPAKVGKEAITMKANATTVVAMEYPLRFRHLGSRLSLGNVRTGASIMAKTVTVAEIVCGTFGSPGSARLSGASAMPIYPTPARTNAAGPPPEAWGQSTLEAIREYYDKDGKDEDDDGHN